MEEQLNLFLNQQSKTEPDEEPTKKPNPDPQKIIHPFSQRAITYDKSANWTKLEFKPDVKRNLEHGWLLPYLGGIDHELFKRWGYWSYLQQVPLKLAPKLQSGDFSHPNVQEFIHGKPFPLLAFDKRDSVRDWLYKLITKISLMGDDSGGWGSIEFFLDWFLFGVGHPHFQKLPEEETKYKNATQMLYQCFDLFPLMAHPHDYLGEILALLQNPASQQSNKFYPTPMSVVQVMCQLTGTNNLLATSSEVCCGSGAILLGLSNYTLSGVFMDKSKLLIKAALVQCYLYAPWYAMPIWWLEHQNSMAVGNSLSGEVQLDFHTDP